MKNSLFFPLEKNDLTCMGIYYDWKTDRITLRAAKEWSDDVNWSKYTSLFDNV